MVLLFQRLHDGRHSRNRLGLGVGDMPRFQHQARAVLADGGLLPRHVHGVPAAGYGDVASSGQSADDGADQVLDPIPPTADAACWTFSMSCLLIFMVYCLVKYLKKFTAAGSVTVNS